jgi:hypothetical protein
MREPKEECMRKPSSRDEATPNLSPSLTHRLNVYALAAGAAGAGLLASVQAAEAKVVYTPAHVVIRPGSTYGLDLTHHGVTNFLFTDFIIYSGHLSVVPQHGSAVEVPTRSDYFPSALKEGARIGRSKYFFGSCVGCLTYGEAMADAFSGQADQGYWINVKDRFLGMRFYIGNEVHYGWARFNVEVNGLAITAVLTGYAYETQAGRSILAGQISGTDNDAGETEGVQSDLDSKPISQDSRPAPLGVLALGAQGLPLWRSNAAELALK